ncbi:unnamed protein product [Brassica oleracea]
MYISIVESILTADEIERVRGFLGPVMRLSGRSEMKLSGKTVYGEYVWELLKGHTHKLRDVLNQLKKTRVDASDERVCLAMLLLVESILLPKNNKGTFPLEYVNKAKDMMYPWGRDAYLVLLRSIQKAVANHLEDNSKFELQGYPLVLHLWLLESIPLLRDKFSNWAPTVDVPGPIYLCEKNTELENPSLERVLQIEAHKNLKVTCILPPIPHDPEDDVSMEDEHSDELESVKDISKKGYKFKADDWKNRSVDTLDTLNALIHMTIHMTEHVETSQASASIEEDSENTKLNKIIELMMENAKRMKDQMSLLEAENMELRARVSELEGNQNVAPHTQTPVFPTNVTQQRSSGTPLSPMSQQPETPSLQTQEFSPNLPRETGREPFNETPSLQTQEFSPNLPREVYAQDITPSNANEKRNLSDEDATEPATVIIETPVFTPLLYLFMIQILFFSALQVGTEATNETPVSPIAPHSIEIPVFTPIQTQQVGTEATNETPVSPIAPQKTQHLQTSASSPLSTLFENGADVEIATSDDATCRIWYPGNVFATNRCDGIEKVAITLFADQKRVTVTADKIRPKPPADDRENKFEMMDNVEAFYSKGWSRGQVRMILGENTFSVYLNSSMETLEFKASDLRIHREWLDGVNDIYSVRFNSSTEFIKFNLSDLRIPKDWVDGVWKMEKEKYNRLRVKATAHPVDHVKKGKPVVGMKRKATAQLVDRLAFLQREEKRPIVPRNPPMPVTPEYWPLYINGNKIEKNFFEYLDYAEKNLKEKHVDAAFAMQNQKRIEQSSWFSEQGIPKACFVPVQFLETVKYCYETLQKPNKKGINILQGWVGEVVRGLIRSNKMWMQDVDIVYGVVHERLVDHFIGVEIHLMENTITIFHYGVHKVKENPLIQKLAVLILAIKLEMMNEEINFNDIVLFQVKKAEGLPKTKFPFNCGLFVVKMLECRSLGLKKMSSINDDIAMDLRSKLCCEMFDQFMDKDFQEGCSR